MTQVRFHIGGGPTTEWYDEVVRHGPNEHTAPALITKLRAQFPDAAIRIERRGDVRTPNPVRYYRFKIQVGESTYYSKLVQELDKDVLRTQVREEFPKGVVTEEIIG